MFDVLARDGEDVHVRFYGAKTDEAFSKQLAGALFEGLGPKGRHALEDVCAFADVGAFIGADEVGDVNEQRVLALARGVDQAVDGLEHAHFAEEVDLSHGESRFHWPAAS